MDSIESKEFVKGLEICAQLFSETFKHLQEHPINFAAIDKSVDKLTKKLSKYFEKITLNNDIFSIMDEIGPINTLLGLGGGNNIARAFQEFNWAFSGKDWSKPSSIRDTFALSGDLIVGPLYIFPKDGTSILLLRVTEPIRTSKEFKYFEPFYLLARMVYKMLEDPRAYLRKIAHIESSDKPKCSICDGTGVCYECGGVGEVEGEKGDLITCPICKGFGSCTCERA